MFHFDKLKSHIKNLDLEKAHKEQRGFGHGGLRLVVLHLIAQNPQHGYELIKTIEGLTAGNYRPSAGVVYPLLAQLMEKGLLEHQPFSTLDDGKQIYKITALGRQILEEKSDKLEFILQQVQKRVKQPSTIIRAIENLKYAIHLKLNEKPLTDKQATELAKILDEAVQKIEQL